MSDAAFARFKFIGHALTGSGPFRPTVSYDGNGAPLTVGTSYLVSYPRESTLKFARRNELAWFSTPMSQHCSRFAGYLLSRPPQRDLPHPLYEAMADDIDGKGNAVDIFWSLFVVHAKARGSMLLLVDMPQALPASLQGQMSARAAPYWSMIAPETVKTYQLGNDGKFDSIEFTGTYSKPDGAVVDCTWRFTRTDWSATDKEGRKLAGDAHGIGECPVLSFTESGDFPCFGPFAPLADMSKRLFNLHSELDEILRAQTFSLLTMQVPDGTTDEQKIKAAQAVGETIGTANLMVHAGSTPAFIAPPDGPARVYLDTISALKTGMDEIGLSVEMPNEQESGIAMQFRFQALNSALGSFAARMEDFERRAWDVSRKWLKMEAAPAIGWRRDFTIADVTTEMQILAQMQLAAMPAEVIAAQQKRIVALQFPGTEAEYLDVMNQAIMERTQERKPAAGDA